MFVTPPIDVQEVLLLESLKINLSPLVLRLLGFALLALNSYLFSKLFPKKILPFFLFLINPWSIYLHTFFTFQCLALTLALILINKQKLFLFLFLSLIVFLLFAREFSKDYSFLSKLSPSTLSFEINERQKIDFLATNKTFILPAPLRKIIYNKPYLAIDKSIKHLVSFFDFEQMAAPQESYEILKLSGLSPKGNFPFFFIWEIPLIIYGIFLNKKLLPFFLFALIPIFVAEKKFFSQTALLTLPLFLSWETTALFTILPKLKPKVFLGLATVVTIFGVFPYYKDFYTKPLMYQNSQSYFYREIVRWVSKNRDKNIVVTTMFGPTEKMLKYYLGDIPVNISFAAFDLTHEPAKDNTYYLGFPGQFVKQGKNLQEMDSRVPIIGEIKGEDELVFEYGENLWIGYQK